MQRWYDDLRRGDFVAHVYRNEIEQSRVILDLLNWLNEDEKFVYLTDKWPIEGSGPGVEARNSVFEAAIREGRFDATASYCNMDEKKLKRATVSEILYSMKEKAQEEGFKGLLIGSEDSWISASLDDFQRYVVGEMQLALKKLPPNTSVMCHYDGRLFNPSQIERLTSMHPLTLTTGRLYRNYWVVSSKSWDSFSEMPKVTASKAETFTLEK